MKVSQILNSQQSLNKLLQLDIPITLGMRVKKLISEVETALELYEEKRKKLFEKYGNKPDKEGNITIKDSNLDKFNKAMQALMDSPIEISDTKIKVSELPADAVFSTADLLSLDWLIIE